MNEFGDLVHKYRNKHGYTKKQLAKKVGKSLAFIAKIEAGTAYPSLETLAELALALDIPAYYLIQFPRVCKKHMLYTLMQKCCDQSISKQKISILNDLAASIQKHMK